VPAILETINQRVNQLAHIGTKGYPLRYSGGGPERSGRPSVGSNPTETTIQGRKWGTGLSMQVRAAKDGRARTRINWLLRQLRDAPDDLRITVRPTCPRCCYRRMPNVNPRCSRSLIRTTWESSGERQADRLSLRHRRKCSRSMATWFSRFKNGRLRLRNSVSPSISKLLHRLPKRSRSARTTSFLNSHIRPTWTTTMSHSDVVTHRRAIGTRTLWSSQGLAWAPRTTALRDLQGGHMCCDVRWSLQPIWAVCGSTHRFSCVVIWVDQRNAGCDSVCGCATRRADRVGFSRSLSR